MRLTAKAGRPAGTGRGDRDASVRDTFVGGSWILLADSLFIPASLLIAAFLTRRLGPSQYGLYVLAVAIAGWLEWTLSSILSRAAVRQIAASGDWRPAGAAITRALLSLGGAAGVVLWMLATPVAALLGDRDLAPLLRLSAPGLPLAGLVFAHRFVLVGLGRFHARAVAGAVRSIARLALVVLLVYAGLGARGAVVATVIAVAFELAAARWYVRPAVGRVGPTPWRELGRMAGPLFLAGICLRALERVDLVALQAIGGNTADTGTYGAAQNLALLPGFVIAAFTPVLLASVTRLAVAGRDADASHVARQALKGGLWLAPLGGAVAGAAPALVVFLFGAPYAAAGPLLAILCLGSIAQVIVAVVSTLLAAIDRIPASVAIVAPLVPLAIVADWAAIPHFGMTGAAVVTASVWCIGAVLALVVLRRAMTVSLPRASVLRVAAITAATAVLAAVLPGEGVLVIARLAAVLGMAGAALVASGEIPFSTLRAVVESRSA